MKEGKNYDKEYPPSENFRIVDAIGVPHPFMITPKHVTYASDNHSGMLGSEAILAMEKGMRSTCGWRGCNLLYEEHKQALVIACKVEINPEGKPNKELHEKLLEWKPLATEQGFEGFAFLDKRNVN